MKYRFYANLAVYRKALTEQLETLLCKKPVLYMLVLLAVLLAGESPALPSSAMIEGLAQQTPFIVGEVEQHTVRIDYQRHANKSQMITHPGASFIKVHFMTLDLSPGDYVTISDAAGVETYTYPGSDSTSDGESGFWSLSITGDTVVIQLHARQSSGSATSKNGVFIDRYGWGYPQDAVERIIARSICGARDERRDVACYRETHPAEFQSSNAVARLLVYHPDGYYAFCTGWRVGVGAAMLTNQHCLPSQTGVAGAEIWFNYQNQACGMASVGEITKVTGNRLLATDPALDFSLFTVNDPESIARFGFLDVDARPPVLGEQIYIPQHGNGSPRQLGIESDLNDGNVCRIDASTLDGLDNGTDTGYYCDTAGGSSGSPVLASSSHKVIALHHFGNPSAPTCTSPNQGVRMDRIWPHIEPYVLQVSPFGSTNGSQPAFTWKAASSATWYYLWVNGPGGNVIRQWYPAAEICKAGTCAVTPNATLKSGSHTWWIQTWSSAGYGPWSDGMHFNVPAPPRPGKATLISPMGDISMNAPAYTWNEVPGATWYYLWVNRPSGAPIQKWYTATQANCNGSTCAISSPASLTPGLHTWWIQTWSSAGYGPWSVGMTFQPVLPGKAILVSPYGNNETTSVGYTWQEVAGSTWYHLWVNGPSGTVFQQWYTASQAGCNGATCSVAPVTTLGSGRHTWWVRTWNTVGYGPWSDGMDFLGPR